MPLQRLNLENYAMSIREFASADPEMRAQYLLDPPYQRGEVWNIERQRNLVRSLLMGLPIGAVTLNERGQDHEEYTPEILGAIVDGRQRITAIRAFIDDELAVPADWFSADEYGEYIDHLTEPIDSDGAPVDAVRYSTLTQSGRGMFNRCTIGVNHAKVSSVAAEAELYLLLNFGGVAQTDADQARAATIAVR